MKKYIIILLLITPIMVSGQTDSLNHYLKTAAERNPAVKAAFHAYEAALQKIPQMGAYEDPQLEMGFFLEPMEFAEGRQIAQFQLMQMFPWFGTKKVARTEAQHMAQMAFEEFREAKDNLFFEVYNQWFTLCRFQQQLRNNEENRKLLVQLEELALRKFSSATPSKGTGMPGRTVETQNVASLQSQTNAGMPGMSSMSSGSAMLLSGQNAMQGMPVSMNSAGGGMSDVLRIQLEIMEMENNAESLLSDLQVEKAKFNTLLNRPAGMDIQLPDSLQVIDFLFDMSSAMNQMKEQNPMLSMLKEEGLAYKAQAEMSRKMSYPMFGIGLQYMLMGKNPASASTGMSDTGHSTPTPMSSMNGKDMIMPMLSVSIPVFRNKYKAAQKESKFLQSANRERQIDVSNQLQTNLLQFKSQLDKASRKITLYQKQTELAHSAYELVVREFVSGRSDLGDALQIQRQLLDYQFKKSEAIAEYNTMVANIQKLLSSYENKE